MQFTSNELYVLLSSLKPLWLFAVDLSCAVLCGAHLSAAQHSRASLSGVNLTRARLRGAPWSVPAWAMRTIVVPTWTAPT